MIFNRCEISFQSVMIRLNKKRDINKRIFYANSPVGIVDNFFYVTRVNLRWLDRPKNHKNFIFLEISFWAPTVIVVSRKVSLL